MTAPTAPEPALHSLDDAAAILAVSRSTVERLIADKKLTRVRVRGAARITAASLKRYLASLK